MEGDYILLESSTTDGILLESGGTDVILLEYVAAPATSNQGIMMMGVGS
jgi:hypothetical protein